MPENSSPLWYYIRCEIIFVTHTCRVYHLEIQPVLPKSKRAVRFTHTDGRVASHSQCSVHTGSQSAVPSRTQQPRLSPSPRLSHLISLRPSRCLMNIRPDFFPLMIGGINDGWRVRSTTLLARLLQPANTFCALSDGRVSQVSVCERGAERLNTKEL